MISEAFRWDVEKAHIFIEHLVKAPASKEYSRQSNDELIEIITGQRDLFI